MHFFYALFLLFIITIADDYLKNIKEYLFSICSFLFAYNMSKIVSDLFLLSYISLLQLIYYYRCLMGGE